MAGERRILVYNPYLMTLGGGERYSLTLADVLKDHGEVTVAGPRIPALEDLQARGFPSDFRYQVVDVPEFTRVSSRFDIAVYTTNHLTPPAAARRNFLVVQFPFEKLPRFDVFRRRTQPLQNLATYECLVYSEYCRVWLRKRWLQESQVLAPAIEAPPPPSWPKQRMIVSVGRFFANEHSKRQDVLLQAFEKLPPRIRREWTLVLAGGLNAAVRQDVAYLKRIDRHARAVGGVIVRANLSHVELLALYDRATYFWHASGYGRKKNQPGNAEHFGMTTVEAMARGIVPLVYADGGQPDIVTADVGRTWRTLDDLVQATAELAANQTLTAEMADASLARAREYDREHFAARVRQIMGLDAASPLH